MAKKNNTNFIVKVTFGWNTCSFKFSDAESAAIFAQNRADNFCPEFSDYYRDTVHIDLQILLVTNEDLNEKLEAYEKATTQEPKESTEKENENA